MKIGEIRYDDMLDLGLCNSLVTPKIYWLEEAVVVLRVGGRNRQ